jgi:hypothetical protein
MHPVAKQLSLELYKDNSHFILRISKQNKEEVLKLAIKRKEIVPILTLAAELNNKDILNKYFPTDFLNQMQLLNNQLPKKLLEIMSKKIDKKNIGNIKNFNKCFIFKQKQLTKKLKEKFKNLE